MKKILVIEDWPNFVGGIYERASRGTIQGFLLDYELKDVVEFEARATYFRTKVGGDKDLFVAFAESDKIKEGDELDVLVVKKKKLPSFADMKGIFRKKEEPDETK